ncbi:MAG: metallophosphoesterase [Paracoccaceae bacterium]
MGSHPTFVHLTDLHIGEPGVVDDHLYSDTSATLSAILRDVKSLVPQPDFLIASGDLSNHGNPASYVELKRMMAEAGIDMPVLYALGNHDTRPGFYQGMLGRADDLLAPYDHDAVIAGVHIIVMDSSVPGMIGGEFTPEQFDWLQARLDEHAGLPKLLVFHHAPALDEDDIVGEWETLSCADTIRLREVLAGRDIVGILCGHIHVDRVSHWHGIPIVVGIGQHAATDVRALHENLRMVSAAGFALGELRPSGLTVTFVSQPATREELNLVPLAAIAEVHRARKEEALQKESENA